MVAFNVALSESSNYFIMDSRAIQHYRNGQCSSLWISLFRRGTSMKCVFKIVVLKFSIWQKFKEKWWWLIAVYCIPLKHYTYNEMHSSAMLLGGVVSPPPAAWAVRTSQDGSMLSYCVYSLLKILTPPSVFCNRNQGSSDQTTFFQYAVELWWVYVDFSLHFLFLANSSGAWCYLL